LFVYNLPSQGIFDSDTRYTSATKTCLNATVFLLVSLLTFTQLAQPLLDQFPNITIHLQGIKLQLGADHYLQPTYGFNNQLYLCLGISDGGPNSLIILGDTFMKGKSTKTSYLPFA
jgi:hypothetical protein